MGKVALPRRITADVSGAAPAEMPVPAPTVRVYPFALAARLEVPSYA
jgi:hypothetical protein